MATKNKTKKKRKKSERQRLIEKCDRLASNLVRHYEKECVTCGRTDLGQCGHYVSRSCKNLRWDFRNIHRQCYVCNYALKGNMTAYAIYMLKRYGKETLEEMEDIRTRERNGELPVKTEYIRKTYEILKEMEHAMDNDDTDSPYND